MFEAGRLVDPSRPRGRIADNVALREPRGKRLDRRIGRRFRDRRVDDDFRDDEAGRGDATPAFRAAPARASASR